MSNDKAAAVTTSGAEPGEASSQIALGDVLARLGATIDGRKGGDPDASYVARLFHKGDDAILKKIGEEACEVVMAAKDVRHGAAPAGLVGEVADLWFHCLIALSRFDLTPADVVAELARREGLSGLEEKALRKVKEREQSGH
ncbi:phosphoribosyl-ATP diphosphatase [Robbsia andropogonis]|uniref:phosphoribosyl-ATP diphosphatase n=1 Tax=Robbsia andropogonis TaxID=28092 RepID=UPI000466063F|nr:phosphoribosyl-ATP diphosphatase [Robbsia andropogonis]MCP1120525.1 phosphoribosyl-ATP diphosphatase [Robbsia andropogonis]MCP1130486.1 phosphoribosyl-ATP diphosphatase [Robbsia andropogonis]